MTDLFNKAFTNSLKNNLDEVLSGVQTIVAISINNKRYPNKMYSKSHWILELDDMGLKIANDSTKITPKEILLSDIITFNVEATKGFNNAPGMFMTTNLRCEIEVKTKDQQCNFICEDLSVLPTLFLWLKDNDINFTDSLGLMELYEDNKSEEVFDMIFNRLK